MASPETIDALLTDDRREERDRRERLLADAWFDSDLLLFECIESEPYPCRLTSQELVELLKMLTCVGEVRKVVLKHLGNRYGRKFANHWQFVRFAREQHLGLDLITPPKRPAKTFEPDEESGF